MLPLSAAKMEMPGVNLTKRSLAALRLIILALGFALLVFSPSASEATGSTLTVSFIDVGQGDSILIQDAAGFDILIDGGKPAAGAAVTAYLRALPVDDIDVMLATHADADHIGGLIEVLGLADIPVRSVLYSGYPGDTATWNNFAAAAAGQGLPLVSAQFPISYTWGMTTAYVLNPAPGLLNPASNDTSVVVLLVYDQNRFLFTGDISSAIEAAVMGRGTPLAAEILKVAHHGSSSSSSSAFLAQVAPRFAVIPVGPNSYGHPAPETLNRLSASGARTLRTDLYGTIVFTCDGLTCTSDLPPLHRVFLAALMR